MWNYDRVAWLIFFCYIVPSRDSNTIIMIWNTCTIVWWMWLKSDREYLLLGTILESFLKCGNIRLNYFFYLSNKCGYKKKSVDIKIIFLLQTLARLDIVTKNNISSLKCRIKLFFLAINITFLVCRLKMWHYT